MEDVNPSEDILSFIITGIILIAIFAVKYKWNFNVLNQKIALKGDATVILQ